MADGTEVPVPHMPIKLKYLKTLLEIWMVEARELERRLEGELCSLQKDVSSFYFKNAAIKSIM